MRAVDLIQSKKEGNELSRPELEFLVRGYIEGKIPDYQMSAFLMAVYFKGMERSEIACLTEIMMKSGEIYDLSAIKGIVVDKHSTGGVGDKITLILAPILAALGVPVAKMSGRGLGHTGGTIDKLESIPGFNVNLSTKKLVEQVNRIKIAIVGQSDLIVPADKMLYALRDVTATVDSIPLIASSIMSKKLATGSKAILLDVKCGNGAFMKDVASAKLLAKTMIDIGTALGRDTRAEITDMSQPLGRAIGNRNEILESIETLKGRGSEDLNEIVYSSGSTLLMQAKITTTETEGNQLIREVINSGQALEKFKEFVIAQNGDVEAIFRDDFLNPKYTKELKADKNGYMLIKSAIGFGLAAMKIGAGRETKESLIDFHAGVYLYKKTGEKVSVGETIFTLYSSKEIPEQVIADLSNAYEISQTQTKVKVIIEKIG